MPRGAHNKGAGSGGGKRRSLATEGVQRGDATPESTAAWAGVPGSTQPRDRSGGDKKIRGGVKQEGV